MVKVKATRRYLDIERHEIMEPDQIFEVKKERADRLVFLGYAEKVEEPEAPAEAPVAEEPKPAPKRTRKKKTE